MATSTVYRSAERKPAVRLTPELAATIGRLLLEGRSQNAIARTVGCSQHLVHKVARGKIQHRGCGPARPDLAPES